MPSTVLKLSEIDHIKLARLPARYNLELIVVDNEEKIPGSFWGDSEAGLVSNKLYARLDTNAEDALNWLKYQLLLTDQNSNFQLRQ